MDEQIKGLIESIGAVAEVLSIAYTAFIKAGFDSQQAMQLTSEMLRCMIPNNKRE